MCDLWKTTLAFTVPKGAIPAQIDYALRELAEHTSAALTEPAALPAVNNSRPPQQVKLYNGGSFFDPHAVPTPDYPEIAERVARFERVVVECHPAFVRDSCVRFRDLVVKAAGQSTPCLEVAMGLETVQPEVLERLNKHMTLDHFARAAEFLRGHGISLRAFVLVKPPFLDEVSALYWAERSVDFAFTVGATAVSLIPTRAGNGALEDLQRRGHFSPPKLATLESAHAYGIGLRQGRVFADLWDLEKFSECPHCFAKRLDRLRRMNLTQEIVETDDCPTCGLGSNS
jgi:radical SAM enzyme (TIGR01210 family)